jgi:hypothetical protein
MMNGRDPTSNEIEQMEADLEALTPEEWQPTDGDEVEILLEGGGSPPPGSMFAVGPSGAVYVMQPDGGLIIHRKVETKTMPTIMGSPNSISMERKGDDLFLYVDGRKIAKRGRPGTAREMTWIPLVPDVRKVTDDDLYSSVVIEYRGGRRH